VEWHNPLAGILLFLFIVAGSVAGTLLFEEWRERVRQRQLEEVVEQFSPPIPEGVTIEGRGREGLELLASGYRKVGDYSRANYIYFWLYRQGEELKYLEQIAQTYLEGGFLSKSREICYQILKRRPRAIRTWEILTDIGAKLQDRELLWDLLESFKAVEEHSAPFYYLLWQIVKLEGWNSQLYQQFGKLERLIFQFPPLTRSYLFYQLSRFPGDAYRFIEKEPFTYLDTYFYRPDIPVALPFFPILKIKGVINFPITIPPDLPFKLKILLQLPPGFARPVFFYQCRQCGRKFPIYFEKCPKCGLLFGMVPILELGEPLLSEKLESFQI